MVGAARVSGQHEVQGVPGLVEVDQAFTGIFGEDGLVHHALDQLVQQRVLVLVHAHLDAQSDDRPVQQALLVRQHLVRPLHQLQQPLVGGQGLFVPVGLVVQEGDVVEALEVAVGQIGKPVCRLYVGLCLQQVVEAFVEPAGLDEDAAHDLAELDQQLVLLDWRALEGLELAEQVERKSGAVVSALELHPDQLDSAGKVVVLPVSMLA